MGLKILHVIDNLSVGGAETLLKNTVNLLPEHRHHIVFLQNSDYEIFIEFKGDVSFECLDFYSWKNVFSIIKKFKAIAALHRPDIIHSHLYNATLLTRFVKPRNIPHVSTIHSTYSIDAFKQMKALLAERLTANKQQGIIGVSQFVLDDYLKHINFRGKQFVLMNFLPQEFFLSKEVKAESGTLRCVAVGTLKSAKNYMYLLKSFFLLNEREITLDVYGVGPQESEMRDYIIEKNLKVNLKGNVTDIQAILPDYDLFIQASEHEGFGISVVEAMALKIPVLLSDIKVFREITNGLAHFFSLNDPAYLSKTLISLKSDIIERNKYVSDGFRFVCENYTAKIYKERLMTIYSQLVEEKK